MIHYSDINSLSTNHDHKNGNDDNYVVYHVRQITSMMKKNLLIQNQYYQFYYDRLYQQNCLRKNEENFRCNINNHKSTLKIMACGWLYLILMIIIIITSNMIIEASALLSSSYSTLNQHHHHHRDHQHSSSIDHHFQQSNYVNINSSSIGQHSG